MCPSGRGAGDGPKGVASNGVRRGYLGFADFGSGIRVRTLFPPLLTAPAFDIAFVWGVLAAGCVLCLLDALIGPALLWIKYETPPSHLLREVILPPLPSDAIGVLTAVATSFVTVVFNPAAALTLFGGGALSLITMNLVREHREKRRLLEAENAWLRDGLRTPQVEFATRLVQSIERKDGLHRPPCGRIGPSTQLTSRESSGWNPSKSRSFALLPSCRTSALVSVADEVLFLDATQEAQLRGENAPRKAPHPG